MESLEVIGQNAKEASRWLGKLGTTAKNDILKNVAEQILELRKKSKKNLFNLNRFKSIQL